MFAGIESFKPLRIVLLRNALLALSFGAISVAFASGAVAQDGTSEAGESEAGEVTTTDSGKRVYIVPMVGQFGTDILPEIYEPIIKDIKEANPDVIVFRIKTKALSGNEGFMDIVEGDRGSQRPPGDNTDFYMVRDLRRQFGIELDDYEQMLWVENANGILGIMAFGWKDMVMSPRATIGDIHVWFRMMKASAKGDNVFGKYFDAMLGILEGVAERGGWTTPERQPLWEAMADPRQQLSTTWVGRRAIFYPNTSGDLIIDNSGSAPPTLLAIDADMAEDLLVTKGVVRDMDDIAMLMGWPRYEVIGDAEDVTSAHHKHWNALLERALGSRDAYLEGLRAADIQGLATCQRALKQLQGIERSKPSHAICVQAEGASPRVCRLQILLDRVDQQVKDLRNGRGGRGGGGNGRGGGAPNGGGGGGGARPG